MRHTYQLGYSLLESLMALAIMSALCLSLMQLQLRLFKETQRIAYQQLVMNAQISLAERIKSCLGNTRCTQLEIAHVKNNLEATSPQLTFNLIQQNNTYISTISFNHQKENIQLVFDHAS